jgi:hypothetical protein
MRSIKINNTTLPYGYLKSWSISDKINTNSTMSFAINDLKKAGFTLNVGDGMPVELWNCYGLPNLIPASNDFTVNWGERNGSAIVVSNLGDQRGLNNATELSFVANNWKDDMARVITGLTVGETYIISFFAKVGTASNFVMSLENGSGVGWNYLTNGQIVVTSPAWQKYSKAFVAPSTGKVAIFFGSNALSGGVNQTSGTTYIAYLKLELGSCATDWIPHMADIDLDNPDKLFAGIINQPEKSETMPGFIEYNISASDNTAIANRRRVAATTEWHHCDVIINDYILQTLEQEGITAGIIRQGALVSKATFNYCTVAEAMKQLCDLSSFNWYIDVDKKLNFMPNNEIESPWTLDDSVQHNVFQQKQSSIQYRNTQYVKAGKTETALQELEYTSPQPDGTAKAFTLRFPVAKKPQLFNNSGEIDPGTIGVDGIDKEKAFYFTFGSPIITCDAAPDNGSGLQATYTGLRNLFTKAEDLISIANRAEKEGSGSGRYEAIDIKEDLVTQQSVQDFASSQLYKYKQIEDKISFKTEKPGLRAGQLLPVIKPLFGINEKFLVESVGIVPIDANTIEYSINALNGISLGGWETYFKKIIGDSQAGSISPDDVIVEYKDLSEDIKTSTNYTYSRIADLKCGTSVKCDTDLYPGSYTKAGNLNE